MFLFFYMLHDVHSQSQAHNIDRQEREYDATIYVSYHLVDPSWKNQ